MSNVKVYVLPTSIAGCRNITPTVNGAVMPIPMKSEDSPEEKPLPVGTDILSTKIRKNADTEQCGLLKKMALQGSMD